MSTVIDPRPALAILAALLAGLLLVLTKEERRNLREFWSLLGGLVSFSITLSLLPIVLRGDTVEFVVAEFIPNAALKFRVDALGQVFGMLASFLWIPSTIYNIGYMRGHHEKSQTRYYFFFTLAVATAVGVAYAGNLLTMLIFYEVLSISAYPLVLHNESEEAKISGRKYLMYLLPGGALALVAIIITYIYTGTLDYGRNGILMGSVPPVLMKLLFAMFVIGFGIKAAVMPFHSWLPAAMIAPTPVSGLLHAVAVVNAGVFAVMRVVLDVFGAQAMRELNLWLPLAYAASFTILMASIYALKQTNLKLRLAFSTVSQLSYMILGVALLTPSAVTGGIVHIVHQGLLKITLFFCAGAIFVHTGKKDIAELKGIGKKMPFTMGAFTVGAIGMIGLPPTAGFITKWFLMLGSLEAEQLVFVVVLIASSMLNAAYFFPIIYDAFFRDPEDGSAEFDEASLPLVAPVVFTAIISIAFGIRPDIPGGFLENAGLAMKHFLEVQP